MLGQPETNTAQSIQITRKASYMHTFLIKEFELAKHFQSTTHLNRK